MSHVLSSTDPVVGNLYNEPSSHDLSWSPGLVQGDDGRDDLVDGVQDFRCQHGVGRAELGLEAGTDEVLPVQRPMVYVLPVAVVAVAPTRTAADLMNWPA